MNDDPERAKIMQFEERPPTVSACQVTRDNYNDVARLLQAETLQFDMKEGTVTFFVDEDDANKVVMHWYDYLIIERVANKRAFKVISSEKFGETYQVHVNSYHVSEHLQEAAEQAQEKARRLREESSQDSLRQLLNEARQVPVNEENSDLIRRLVKALERTAK